MSPDSKKSPTTVGARDEALADSEVNLAAIDKQLEELGLDIEVEKQNDSKYELGSHDETENVKVMLRCRPLLRPKERESCVIVGEADKYVQIAGTGRQFFFDATFGPESDNDLVYMKSCRHLVDAAFKGYNCTLFLYGQTGTGKTYTHSSLTSNSFAHLFDKICESNKQSNFLIRASYYELYNEEIRDLLSSSNKTLELRESKTRGVYIRDLTCFLVNNVAELEKLKKLGDKRRATAATKMNEHSSRSHSIFSITIETVVQLQNVSSSASSTTSAKSVKEPPARRSAPTEASSGSVRVGRIHLIDLAGSERQAKSGTSGARLKEASKINLSLTCLSLVIRALTDSKSGHVPYRNSKLTKLLSSSLGGNSKTMLIACVSPARSNLDETLDTLRFASRTKRIKNKAVINEDSKDALLRNYRRQIEELRRKLREQQNLISSTATDDDTIEALAAQTSPNKQVTDASKDQEVLLRQLRLLRAKIMVGGENLLEKMELHQKLLDASKRELEDKRLEEQKLRGALEKKREIIDQVTKSKGSLEGQVIDLNDKLKRALILHRRCREEQRDLHTEHQQLKGSLLQTIKATSKEIKYADCIIGDFIPREYLDLINTYAQYDDESDEWQIKYVALSGNNIAQTRRITMGDRPTTSVPGNGKRDSSKSTSTPRMDPYIRLKDVAQAK